MGFTLSDGMVRGDVFTESGKWKYTVAIDMNGHYDGKLIHDAVRDAVLGTPEKVLGVYHGVFTASVGWRLVVLEPFHIHSHPVTLALPLRGD